MDAKAKQALSDKLLASSKSFDELLSEASRAWFIEKIIAAREAAGDADAQIEPKTKDLIAATKTLVAAERDFALALQADGNGRYTPKLLQAMRRHRVEILYGAVALEPQLCDATQLEYLRFLARRRLRAVCRQYVWVNPNYQGYFHYPDDCLGNVEWRPNEDALASYWDRDAARIDGLPFTLKPAGVADPAAALKKLFVKKTDPCRSNLTDCATVADITFLDGLLEGKDATQLLKALPAVYLNVTVFWKSAFSNRPTDRENPVARVAVATPPRDLQVGDQAYIYNHPLYKTFRPTGNWTGEWAFVYSAGNRDYRSEKGFVFGGHGMEGTLFKFYRRFVDELSGYIALARQLAQVHLAFMAGGAAAIAPGTVISDSEEDVRIFDPVGIKDYKAPVRHRLLAYDAVAKARDLTKIPTKAKRKPKSVQAGFLVLHSKVEDAFYLAKIDTPNNRKPLSENLKKTAADLPGPDHKVHFPIRFVRGTPADAGASDAQRYAVADWGVAYHDEAAGTDKVWPFFVTIDGEQRRKELTTDGKTPVGELFDAPFQTFTGSTNIMVNQPRLDFGDHRAFLASSGGF